jgi:colicin import membrane protein
MHAAADRLEFAPPAAPGMLRAFLLAIAVHVLLVIGLTLGVQWKHEALPLTAEAELWSAIPEEAAPKLQETPPEPEVAPEPPAKPAPEPEPVVEPPKVDIALEQEKKRIKQQKQLTLELQQEKLKQDKLKAEKLKAEQLKAEQQKQALADKAKQASLDQKKTEAEAKKLEAQRQDNLKRMAGLAGASGPSTSSGTAQKSSGPSASYAGRIRARIKPNIVFTEDIAGNPTTEIEVRTAPDGTIVGRKLLKSSGVKSWDEAVLKAIDKTEVLPRDTDGRVPSVLEIGFRPKE